MWFDKHDISEFWDELTTINVKFELQKPKDEILSYDYKNLLKNALRESRNVRD